MTTKVDILEKASELFLQRGYDNTPMSAIARPLRMSKAGLYHHFPNKESLLFHVIKRLMEERFIPILEQTEKISDPEARIKYLVQAWTHLLTEDERGRLVVHDARRLKPKDFKKIALIWRRTFDTMKQAAAELESLGRAKNLNKTFMSFAAIGMCCWTFYWFDYSRRESSLELSNTYTEILLRGILK